MNRMENLSKQSSLPNHEKAIDILQKLKRELGSSALAYFITPNIVLTLSGARAFCDNGFDSKNNEQLEVWLHDIKSGLTVLQNNEDIPYVNAGIHETPGGMNVASYSLISRPGLSFALGQTDLLGDDYSRYTSGDLTGAALMKSLTKDLRGNKALDDFKSTDIDAVGFGILLGYPDKAIVSGMKLWADDRDAELVDAKISFADFYDCPQPVYSYAPELVDDSQIIKHEKMWSELLEKFYESDFHKQLQKDDDFQNKVRELHLK